MRSGLNAWLNRPTSARQIHDAKLITTIETSVKASDRTYGYCVPCVAAAPARRISLALCMRGLQIDLRTSIIFLLMP